MLGYKEKPHSIIHATLKMVIMNNIINNIANTDTIPFTSKS